MKSHILALAMAVIFFVPAVASAVIDPEPNKLGLYFDEGATEPCFFVAAGVPFTAYIILTNPTYETLYGWEAAVRPVSGDLLTLSADVLGGGESSADLPDLAVTYSTPLVLRPVTVLATVLLYTSFTDARCLVVTGVGNPSLPEDSPLVWWQEGVPSVIETTELYPNGVAAVVNGCAFLVTDPAPPCTLVVSDAQLSWGALKSAYR